MRRNWSCLICAFLLMGITALVQAQSAEVIDTLQRANQLYENGQFDEAAQTYQQVLDSGVVDHTIYYNLGNAWFKLGDIGRAILNYERAARLAPRDDDIQANLSLARSLTLDQYEDNGAFATDRLANLGSTWLTLDETALLSLTLGILFVVFYLAYQHSHASGLREVLQYILALTLLLLLGSAFLFGGRLYIERTTPPAIILALEVDVVSGPGEQYLTEFTLHSGTKVSVLETRGQWTRLALPGGQLQGWVSSDALSPLQP